MAFSGNNSRVVPVPAWGETRKKSSLLEILRLYLPPYGETVVSILLLKPGLWELG